MVTTSTWPQAAPRTGRRTGLALLIAIVGVIAGIVVAGIGTYQAWRAPDEFQRTVVGGRLSISLEAGTDAVIYYEGQPVPSLADLGLTLTSPNGAAIAVRPYELTLNYDRNDVVATAVGRFVATESGSYELVSAAPRGFASIAVGRDLAPPVYLGLGLGAVIAAAGIVLGFLVLALSRRTTR